MSKQSPGPLHLIPDTPIASRGFDRLDHLAVAIAKPGGATASDPASRDIEVLRHKVNSILGNSDRRILIFMDNIDRLTPEEMTQLLLIIRAVADPAARPSRGLGFAPHARATSDSSTHCYSFGWDRVQPSSTHRRTQRTRCRSICSLISSSPANC